MADQELSAVLEARRARLVSLADQLKAAAQSRAARDQAQAQARLDQATSDRNRAQSDASRRTTEATAQSQQRIAAAQTDRDRRKAAADTDTVQANAKAASALQVARNEAAAKVSQATAARDQARNAANAQRANAQTQAAAVIAKAQADKDAAIAAAQARSQAAMDAANAQLAAANQKKATVAADQTALDQRRAQLQEDALHCHDQFTLLGYHGWYASFQSGAFKPYTQGFTSTSARWLVRPSAPLDNGPLRYGDTVALTSAANTYLQARPDGSQIVMSGTVGAWETWTLCNPANVGAFGALIPRKGNIALKSAHGRFLVAESNGIVNANRDACGPWETWVLDVKQVVRFPPPAPPVIDWGGINLNLGNLNLGGW